MLPEFPAYTSFSHDGAFPHYSQAARDLFDGKCQIHGLDKEVP